MGIHAVPVTVANTVMQITRSSAPLPVQPPSPPLAHNQTVDLDVDVKFDGDPAKNGGFRSFVHGLYQVAFQYEIQNLKKLGALQIILPLNILHLLTPLSMLKPQDFKGMWSQIKARQNCPPNCQSVLKSFTLDLQKAQNMPKLKQIIQLNETNSFHIIPDIEANMPNVVYFAAQLRRPELMPDQPPQSMPIFLLRLALTRDGQNCQLELQAGNDCLGLSETIVGTILNLIAK